MTAKDSASEAEHVAGNFDLGECFCDARCRYGHKTRFFNVGRCHYLACDICRTFIFLGSNLVSSWRHEDEDVWEANCRSIEGYEPDTAQPQP